jgi:hypothetical protein
MSIRSDENRRLLTTILLEHPLKKRNSEQFQYVLDQELERLHKDRFSYKSNLMLMNKEILRKFQTIANQMLTPQKREVIKEVKAQTFEHRLKEKQESFEKMIRLDPPAEIDFTDKTSEIPVSNELDYTMAKREDELKKIMNSQTKNKNVEAWINGESNAKPNDESNLINIDHSSNVELNTVQLKERKRVTFEDAPVSNDLLSKLKLKTQDSSEENNQLLKEILDNQKIIIKLLTKV